MDPFSEFLVSALVLFLSAGDALIRAVVLVLFVRSSSAFRADSNAISHPLSVSPCSFNSNPASPVVVVVVIVVDDDATVPGIPATTLGIFCLSTGRSGSNLVISGLPSFRNAARTAFIVNPYRSIRK